MNQPPAPELSRRIAIDRIGSLGLDIDVVATPEEREALAGRLAVPAVAKLVCHFRLEPQRGGKVEASGVLSAETTRICVASLEPFQSITEERFALRFVPEEALAGDEDATDDWDEPDEVGYRGNHIDLGEAAVEQLGLALDPYPRRPDVVLDGVGQIDSAPTSPEEEAGVEGGAEMPDESERPNPFSVLASRLGKAD